jgi:hypothetical protein
MAVLNEQEYKEFIVELAAVAAIVEKAERENLQF